ncbi:MAG: hypothetical protein ACRDZ7_12265 [Acidimicrobiia bacterium]
MGNDDATVRFEPCETFSAGADPTAGSCSACGWLEEDHWFAELDRHRTAARPRREVALTGSV